VSIKFLFTISCHKLYTKCISKLHYNSIKRLNIHFSASNIREELGPGFVRIFGRPQFRSLSKLHFSEEKNEQSFLEEILEKGPQNSFLKEKTGIGQIIKLFFFLSIIKRSKTPNKKFSIQVSFSSSCKTSRFFWKIFPILFLFLSSLA